MAVAVDVTRRPFSFVGDEPGIGPDETMTWHDRLLEYVGGHPDTRDGFEASMQRLAQRTGVKLDYGVDVHSQPVEAQRALLWATRQGKAEDLMNALNVRHFTERKSAVYRSTILDAAREAELDADALNNFLETDELKKEVWKSYGETIRVHKIRSIPYLYFNNDGPEVFSDGGPYGSAGGTEGAAHNGSGSVDTFYQLFVQLVERELSGTKTGALPPTDEGAHGGACTP